MPATHLLTFVKWEQNRKIQAIKTPSGQKRYVKLSSRQNLKHLAVAQIYPVIMSTILELLRKPSELDQDFKSVFGNITIPTSFSSTELTAVLEGIQKLPVPDSSSVISETLTNLRNITAKLPSQPGEITATLQQELQNLLQNGGALGNSVTPIARFLEVIAPLLEKFNFLGNFVIRINEKVNGFSEQVRSRNLTNLSTQFGYLLNVFDLFPELNNVSPFKELKEQVKILNNVLNNNFDNFIMEILGFVDDLPNALDYLLGYQLNEVSQIEDPLAVLNDSDWLKSYNQALEKIEAINLDNLNLEQITNYLNIIETEVSTVGNIGTKLTKQTQVALTNIEKFDGSKFFPDWSHDLQSRIIGITPSTSRELSATLGQMQQLVSGVKIGSVQSEIASIHQQLDQVVRKVDFSTLPNKMKEIATKIDSTVDTVDQGLVKVATFLSNLIKELGNLINSIDLSKLREKVENEFNKLSNQANGLLSQIDKIPAQLNSLVEDLGEKLNKIDLKVLKDKIAQFFEKIASVLNDPQIQYIRTSAQQAIEAIAENLSNVSLKPVFERVLSEMADVKTKLATVKVSQLNDLLKKALKLALDELRKINFAEDIADKLKKEFHEILNNCTGLIKPLQEKYQEIVAQIEEFAPGTWIAKELATPFEGLLAKLAQFEPSKVLNYLQNIYNSLREKLEVFSPTTLLYPLSELYNQAMTSLCSLSPKDLIAPLNNLLKQFTDLIDQLGIEDFVFKVNSNFGKSTNMISYLSPEKELQNSKFWQTVKQLQSQGENLLKNGENQINECLEDLIEKALEDLEPDDLEPDDPKPLESKLEQPKQIRDIIDNQSPHPTVQRFQEIAARLKEQPFSQRVTELTKRWLAQKTRFNATVPLRSPDLQQKYNELKAKLQLLSPIQVLGEATNNVERFTTRLSTLQEELTLGQQNLGNLLTPDQHDQLSAILPKKVTTIPILLRDSLEWLIGRPAKTLLRTLKQQLAQIDKLFVAIETITLKFKVPLQALLAIPGAIGEALLKIKQKINTLNFDFLQDELQTIIDGVIGQFEELNPKNLLEILEALYQKLLDTMGKLYPEKAVKKLDIIYKEKVLQKLSELHPNEVIAKPLDEQYQKIRELQKQLNLDKIFDTLIGKLDTLEQELDDGLKQTATAFNQLLQALPL